MSQAISTILVAEYTNRAGTETYLLQLLTLLSQYEEVVLLITIGGEPADHVSQLSEKFGFTHLRMGGNFDVQHNKQRIGKLIQHQLSMVPAQKKAKRVIVSVGTPGALTEYLNFGDSSYYILHTYPHGNRHKFLGRLIARSIPRETTVLCVSEFSKLELFKRWGRDLKVCVVPNGVPSQEISTVKRSSSPVVLSLGSVEPYKNPELWLKIALSFLTSAPDTKAQFIWVGDGSQLDRLNKQIPNSLRDQITFVGSVGDPSSYFRKATVYMQPSKIESFGLAVAEALSYGIPCVVAISGGLPEVVTDKCSILVAPDDVAGYVDALSKLIGNAQLHNQMAEAALNRHTNELSIEYWQTRMATTLDL